MIQLSWIIVFFFDNTGSWMENIFFQTSFFKNNVYRYYPTYIFIFLSGKAQKMRRIPDYLCSFQVDNGYLKNIVWSLIQNRKQYVLYLPNPTKTIRILYQE